MELKNNSYEIKIVKSSKIKSDDLTKPFTSTKALPGQKPGQYYLCELLAQKRMVDGINKRPQKRRIPFTVFDSPDQTVLFNDIKEVLSNPANFKETTEKELEILPSAFGISGLLVTRPAGGVYTMTRADGSKIMKADGVTPATRSIVRFFCHEEDDIEARFAQELARIPADAWIEANANDDKEEAE